MLKRWSLSAVSDRAAFTVYKPLLERLARKKSTCEAAQFKRSFHRDSLLWVLVSLLFKLFTTFLKSITSYRPVQACATPIRAQGIQPELHITSGSCFWRNLRHFGKFLCSQGTGWLGQRELLADVRQMPAGQVVLLSCRGMVGVWAAAGLLSVAEGQKELERFKFHCCLFSR